jgi:uncharacterized membrane protein YbhN (UPF0104 family)
MLKNNTKKILNNSIKTILVLLCFAYLYSKLTTSDIANFWAASKTAFGLKSNLYSLCIIIVLMGINWSLEAKKWKLLIATLEPISFLFALKAVLAGVTISLSTPNRAGEFAGKIFYLKTANKADAMLRSITGSLSQVLITFCFGLLAVYYYLFQFKKINFSSSLFLVFTILTILACFLLFFEIKNISKNWTKWNFIRKIIPYHDAAFTLTKFELLKITALSFLRYALFSFQYYLLLKIFGISTHLFQSLVLISLYFLFITLIPTYALSELGVRGSVAIVLFCNSTTNCSAVFASSLLLWIINLAIPALIGTFFVFQLKFFNSTND